MSDLEIRAIVARRPNTRIRGRGKYPYEFLVAYQKHSTNEWVVLEQLQDVLPLIDAFEKEKFDKVSIRPGGSLEAPKTSENWEQATQIWLDRVKEREGQDGLLSIKSKPKKKKLTYKDAFDLPDMARISLNADDIGQVAGCAWMSSRKATIQDKRR